MYDDSLPARNDVLRWASRPTDDAESRRFLHRRLTLYVRLIGTGFGLMYALPLVTLLIFAPQMVVTVHLHPMKVMNLALIVVMFAVWSALRRLEPSEAALRAIEVGVILAISLAVGFAGIAAPANIHLEFALLLVVIFVLILRAAFVPSTALRTAAIGVLCSIPSLTGAYLLATRAGNIDIATPTAITAGLGVWCLATIAASTAVSRVIYGLVTQVKNAMRLGQYTLGEKLGEGGMGSVYRAEHAMLRRPTAVKLLLPGRVSTEALARFEREVQTSSGLTHPNTVAIYDYGRTPEGIFYYAMEYLDGLTLDALVQKAGAQPEGRVVKVLAQVAAALAEAHSVGLIHRDVKPANVMICDRGGVPDFIKVLDFGLVKRVETKGGEITLTQINAITGSPLYMSPEAITRPDQVDARTDIYALGAVGYFLLTGQPPFDGHTVVEICSHHLHSLPAAPSDRLGRAVSPLLEQLILGCLAKDPEARPRDAETLLTQLAECEKDCPWSALEARSWWRNQAREISRPQRQMPPSGHSLQ